MIVEFEHPNDKFRILRDDGPWNSNKAPLLVKDFDGEQQVKNIHLREAAFWVRVYDLSLMA